AVAAHDQIEGALALADAALAGNQDAKTEDVHQDPCTVVRSASESSRIEPSLAIAIGVAMLVLTSGRRARSASTTSSTGGVNPPVMTTQGKSCVMARRMASVRGPAARLSR